MRTAVFTCALVATTLAIAPAASAQNAKAERAMDDWFSGEKSEAFVFFGLGAVSTGTGAYLLTRDTDFSRGAGWTAIGFGAVEMLFATTYTLSLGPRHDELKDDLAENPSQYKKDELDRMNAIADRFVVYRYAEIGILLGGAGLATYGFVKDKPTLAGIGVVAGAHAAIVLFLDYFAERRTHRYIDELEDFQPGATSSPLHLRSGWAFQVPVSGSF
jgi:hypothetical protein